MFGRPGRGVPCGCRAGVGAPLWLLTSAAVSRTNRGEFELLVAPALSLRRRVADQAGLNHLQRAANLELAMQVRARWRDCICGATCLLVDDVLTTGATLGEAARGLREGGAQHVAAVTVAATQRRGIPAANQAQDGDPRTPAGSA